MLILSQCKYFKTVFKVVNYVMNVPLLIKLLRLLKQIRLNQTMIEMMNISKPCAFPIGCVYSIENRQSYEEVECIRP